MSDLRVYSDGSGKGAWAYYITENSNWFSDCGRAELHSWLAEYQALYEALKFIAESGVEGYRIDFFLDELILISWLKCIKGNSGKIACKQIPRFKALQTLLEKQKVGKIISLAGKPKSYCSLHFECHKLCRAICT